jgi:hypothetical protein
VPDSTTAVLRISSELSSSAETTGTKVNAATAATKVMMEDFIEFGSDDPHIRIKTGGCQATGLQ